MFEKMIYLNLNLKVKLGFGAGEGIRTLDFNLGKVAENEYSIIILSISSF